MRHTNSRAGREFVWQPTHDWGICLDQTWQVSPSYGLDEMIHICVKPCLLNVKEDLQILIVCTFTNNKPSTPTPIELSNTQHTTQGVPSDDVVNRLKNSPPVLDNFHILVKCCVDEWIQTYLSMISMARYHEHSIW